MLHTKINCNEVNQFDAEFEAKRFCSATRNPFGFAQGKLTIFSKEL